MGRYRISPLAVFAPVLSGDADAWKIYTSAVTATSNIRPEEESPIVPSM
jgi:hypothetical protein